MSSTPKGVTNNPDGRPTIGAERRIAIALTIDPQTLKAIDAEARRRRLSRGLVVDGIVRRTLLRKRKTT